MTKAVFDTQINDNGTWEMTMVVSGHACFDNTGKDIVCSACSILTQALAASLMMICRPEHAPLVFTHDEEKAEATVWYMAEDLPDAEHAKHLFEMAHTGFLMLEEAYPENVCVAGAPYVMH